MDMNISLINEIGAEIVILIACDPSLPGTE
jgi:hypothetical protein